MEGGVEEGRTARGGAEGSAPEPLACVRRRGGAVVGRAWEEGRVAAPGGGAREGAVPLACARGERGRWRAEGRRKGRRAAFPCSWFARERRGGEQGWEGGT